MKSIKLLAICFCGALYYSTAHVINNLGKANPPTEGIVVVARAWDISA